MSYKRGSQEDAQTGDDDVMETFATLTTFDTFFDLFEGIYFTCFLGFEYCCHYFSVLCSTFTY